MPGNMFIPPPQQRSNPIMGLLGQLALMKVQHDWSMEEKQMALEAKKVESQEAKAEVRSKERSDAMMGGAKFETPSGPIASPTAYQQTPGSYYDPRYGQNVTPPPAAEPVYIDGKIIGYTGTKERPLTLLKDGEIGGKYKPGELKDFKVGEKYVYGRFTGDAKDNFGGIPGWTNTGVEAPRQSQNINVNVDMTKKTQGDLEEKVVEAEFLKDKFSRIEQIYKPEFLQHSLWSKGQTSAAAENVASKFGMKPSEFTTQRNKWKAEVDVNTMLWRKMITGVAGGDKEMNKIESITFNTDKDSPAEYDAKFAQMKIMNDAQLARAKFLLERGLDVKKMPAKERAKLADQYPIENFGYKDILPEKKGQYEKGALYESADGRKMRWDGKQFVEP